MKRKKSIYTHTHNVMLHRDKEIEEKQNELDRVKYYNIKSD